jgi:hypothetical protein
MCSLYCDKAKEFSLSLSSYAAKEKNNKNYDKNLIFFYHRSHTNVSSYAVTISFKAILKLERIFLIFSTSCPIDHICS